jgi:hypothetical protein
MKMPEPIGVVAESRKTISTAFNTTIYTRYRFHQGAKIYDKQALIDLLEAAAVECDQERVAHLMFKNYQAAMALANVADSIRSMKEML